MKNDDVVDYIQGLTNKQSVGLMAQALKGRRSDDGTESHYVQEHWFLSEASRILSDDGKNWEEWEVHALALHDKNEYPEGWDDRSDIFQEGTCTACGFNSIGWAKRITCPICGTPSSSSY